MKNDSLGRVNGESQKKENQSPESPTDSSDDCAFFGVFGRQHVLRWVRLQSLNVHTRHNDLMWSNAFGSF